MKQSLIITALAVVALLFSTTASHSWTIIQLTDNEYDDSNYQVNASGQVVWQGYDGHDWEIFLYDGNSLPIQVTDNDYDDTNPQISDSGLVVWEQNDTSEGDYKIWMYLVMSGISFVCNDRPNRNDRYPDVNSDGSVTWQGWDGSHWQIFVVDSIGFQEISSEVSGGPGDNYRNTFPKINDLGLVVWEQQRRNADDVWVTKDIGTYYDGVSYLLDSYKPFQVDIANTDRMVWKATDYSDPWLPSVEIFYSPNAGEHITQITFPEQIPHLVTKQDPRVSDDGIMVWSGAEAGSDTEIYMQMFNMQQITDNNDGDAHPDIGEATNDLVWQGDDGHDWEIFFASASSDYSNIVQLTRDCDNDKSPLIANNGDVVWTRSDGNDDEIFLARYASGPAQRWATTYGGLGNDRADAVLQARDGGYIVSGSTESFGAGGSDAWLMKLDGAGSVEWEKSFGGVGSEYGVSIDETGWDGFFNGYVLAATTTSFGQGEDDIWVVKLDPFGDVEWERSYGGPGIDTPTCVIRLDCANFGYVVAGKTESFGADDNGDAWVLQLDSDGSIEWQKRYGGASGGEHIADIQRTRHGFIAAGYTYSFGTNGDFWVLKLDELGNVEWQKVYGGPDIDYAVSVKPVGDGGYIVAGSSYSFEVSTASYDAWVVRLDANGDIVWQKAYGTLYWDFVTCIDVADDGGYIMSGTVSAPDPFAPHDAWVVKLDHTGDIVQQYKYSGLDLTAHDSLSAIERVSDSGFITAGVTESFGMGEGDAWVLKLNENGQIPLLCSVMDTWNATSKDTDGTAATTTATVTETTATPAVTTATATDTTAIKGGGCEPTPADLIDLPKTGQTISYYARDDGSLQMGVSWPSSRFIDNSDGTIIDNLTGLMWLTDANCANTIGHDPDETGDGSMHWESALDFVAGINDGTYSISAPHTDWRVPNINEIESLAHWGQSDLATWLGTAGFVNVQPDRYWSSTTYVRSSTSAREIDMSTGHMSMNIKASAMLHVWPVREGQQDYPDATYPANVWKTGQTTSYYPGDDGEHQIGVVWPKPRFIDNYDGTITDSLTGLTWLQDGGCLGVGPWQTALDTVADLNTDPRGFSCEEYTADYDDWRVPNRKEVFSLIDYSQPSPNPSIPPDHSFTNLNLDWYWTSTTYAPLTPENPTWAWSVSLGPGSMSYQHKSGASGIWAVRGGEAAAESPIISLNTAILNNSCPEGGDAADQIFNIWNSGAGTLSYSISDDADWLSCDPETGTSTGETDTITVTYATAGLASGSYSATITVSDPFAPNGPLYIEVNLSVTPVPTISFNPVSLSTSCTQGTDALPQGFTVWNSGDGTLFYSISDDADWLSCSPVTGISGGEGDSITITYATSALAPGIYSATITISDPSASNDPQYVPVELTVGPPPGLSNIRCVAPANESILSSAPTFTWTSVGGTNNRFAVDVSSDWTFSRYWSTYENLHHPIDAESWTMSATLWNRIPSGTYVYWRVRGADLDVVPLTIIPGVDVWWFYKP